ncbi:hypothetical protein FRC01_002460 [Tulasnella sp. 417]|nr:hypothetical protein FRC01_002460 [Tulasnella sp. 417]
MGSQDEASQSAKQTAAMAFLRYLLGPIKLPAQAPAQESQPGESTTVTLNGDPDSHQGYYLARAVHLNHLPLVDLLLTHGANPLLKLGVAIKFAIGRKDERMVRWLMAKLRPSFLQYSEVGQELLTHAVKVDAQEIAYFFIREKGIAPTLQTLSLLR